MTNGTAINLQKKKLKTSGSVLNEPHTRVERFQDDNQLFQREDVAVNRTKFFVLSSLLLTALVVTILTFFFFTKEQKDDFQIQYGQLAVKVVDSFLHNMEMKVWAGISISTIITSKLESQSYINVNTAASEEEWFGQLPPESAHLSWPNVTINDFDEIASAIRALSNAEEAIFSPFVPRLERAAWEEYATKNQLFAGRSEADDLVCKQKGNSNPYSSCRAVSDGIYKFSYNESKGPFCYPVTDDGIVSGPYMPVWQVSPLKAHHREVMFNQRSDSKLARAIDDLINFNTSTLTEVLNSEIRSRDFCLFNNNWSPKSLLYVPVFNKFSGDRKIIGTIAITIKWSAIFEDIFPEYMYGIDVVLTGSTGERNTFRIAGQNVTYLGHGDLHLSSYDMYAHNCMFDLKNVYAVLSSKNNLHRGSRSMLQTSTSKRSSDRKRLKEDPTTRPRISPHDTFALNNSRYLAVSSLLAYNITVFPSQDLMDVYYTRKPVIYTLGVALIFFFTTAVFVIYDCRVEKRQAVIEESAHQTREIVNSLFPAVVRDRMLAKKDNSARSTLPSRRRRGQLGLITERGPKTDTWIESPLVRLGRFMKSQTPIKTANNESDYQDDNGGVGSDAIADLFPDTTIMCADIAGFTAWCSEREPRQVFHLLETVYGSFDKAAQDYGVFKVETVGDCYVAVTGLPEPNKDHAVVMARFAVKVLSTMNELTKELETLLGPGTADLTMRIGLHSGPVTAGVLRGEKSRFQLFGDTINTASRMESTGIKGMIQVSNDTAELLSQSGKSHWLVRREGLVTAKGKGQLQTFWVRIQSKRQQSLQEVNEVTCQRGEKSIAWEANDSRQIKIVTPCIDIGLQEKSDTIERLIKWNVAVLENFLIKMVLLRKHINMKQRRSPSSKTGGGKLSGLGRTTHGDLGRLVHCPTNDRMKFQVRCLDGDLVLKCSENECNIKSEGNFMYLAQSLHGINSDKKQNTRNNKQYMKEKYGCMGESLHGLRGSLHGLRGSLHGIGSKLNLGLSSHGGKNESTSVDKFFDEVDREATESFSFPTTCLKEVSDEIEFPEFDSACVKALGTIHKKSTPSDVLGSVISDELQMFVTEISQMYQDVPFHNFEHASHVTMSANKLVNRLLSQIGLDYSSEHNSAVSREEYLYYSTFGIWSDPLAQFAVVFTALVHDAGHTGLPNLQLVAEEHELALRYNNKSVAEQHSVHIAWELFTQPRFKNLRNCICPTEKHLLRFRQLVINLLIATDIADQDRMRGRSNRWAEAFAGLKDWKNVLHDLVAVPKEEKNIKATLVLEQIMLASDVAHTMQHFSTFVKWNERLFQEMWAAYVNGHSHADPRQGWYESQIGFYDFYIIPLAKKLKECGVFSTAGDEYLGNALENRRRWTDEGEMVTQKLISRCSCARRKETVHDMRRNSFES